MGQGIAEGRVLFPVAFDLSVRELWQGKAVEGNMRTCEEVFTRTVVMRNEGTYGCVHLAAVRTAYDDFIGSDGGIDVPERCLLRDELKREAYAFGFEVETIVKVSIENGDFREVLAHRPKADGRSENGWA